jgi:transcriptional regulator with PAS, ATPase and Fis domain
VNCASIPEALIESELFGYEEGAFTGARKKGGIGKMVLANGGTLFLDEIGDMPLHLQARMLRALQERAVSPLGSNKLIQVDVAVVCATHRNMREMVAGGQFREDLYYRLNGLVVRLPALRERSDLDVVASKLLLQEQADAPPISEAVMQMFRSYHWPGNIRQLGNLLRTARLMADDAPEITEDHLPDDFLEDWQARHGDRPAPVSATAADVQPAAVAPGNAHPKRLADVESMAIMAAVKAHNQMAALHPHQPCLRHCCRQTQCVLRSANVVFPTMQQRDRQPACTDTCRRPQQRRFAQPCPAIQVMRLNLVFAHQGHLLRPRWAPHLRP